MNEQEIPEEAVEPQVDPAPSRTPVEPVAGKKFDVQGTLVLLAGGGALLWGLFAALGAGWGFWSYTTGINGVTWAFFLALAAIVLGVLLGVRAKKAIVPPPRLRRWAGVLLALVYAGWVGSYAIASFTTPAIHDISTDLADPPGFRTLTLRPDNLDAVPGIDDAEMKGMSPQQRWVVIHQKEYDDIRSVRINEPVPSVVAKAERLAEARGWDVASALPEEGRLEATDTSSLFRFKYDIALRIRPTETGEGSIVDMRSVSRVGEGDLGANAKRVRSFLADLSGTVTAVPQ
jgi:hypothetical protein